MATFQLTLDGDQIDQALTGAHLLLRDAWGYTGDLKLEGDAQTSSINSTFGAIAQDFFVTGGQTGYGVLANTTYVDLNLLSATGESYLATVTGFNEFQNLRTDTGFIPLLTGNFLHLDDNFYHSGKSFQVTGDAVEFNLNNTKAFEVFQNNANALWSGFNAFHATGEDGTRFHGKEHQFAGAVSITGATDVEGNFNVLGNLWVSGSPFDVNANVVTGSITEVFTTKGQLLVGTGASGAAFLTVGTSGQVPISNPAANNMGIEWRDANSVLDLGDIHTELDATTTHTNLTLGPFDPTSYGLSLRTRKGFSVMASGANVVVEGANAIAIAPTASVSVQKSQYGIMVGHANVHSTTGNYGMVIGGQSSVRGGNKNIAIGYENDITEEANDYSFVGGYDNWTSGRGDIQIGMSNRVVSLDDWSQYSAVINSHCMQFGSGNRVEAYFELGGAPAQFGITGLFAKTTQIGYDNLVNNKNTIQIGDDNTSAGSGIFLGSDNTQAQNGVGTGRYIAIGDSNTVSRSQIAFGHWHTPNSAHERGVSIGYEASTSRYGEIAKSVAATFQGSEFILGVDTTDATATEAPIAGYPAKRIIIATDTTMAFTFITVARRTDADGESAGYKHEGVIRNDAGTTSVVGTITNTVLGEDTAAWDATMAADDTNDTLKLTVQGEASKNISWRSYGSLVEITG